MSNFKHHDDDTCPHLVVLGRLEAENARLKTEVEHLMVFCNCTLIPNKELQAENARLKAEVERLTKAGNELAFMVNESFDFPPNTAQPIIDAYLLLGLKKWTAAKEGKPGV